MSGDNRIIGHLSSESSSISRKDEAAFQNNRLCTPDHDWPTGDPVTYGRYLTKIAECSVFHGFNYAGGRSFQNPPAPNLRAKNITPAKSGIGSWTRENFISVFKSFASDEIRTTPVPEGEPNTGMPWLQYAGISEEDLGAIYDYLRTVTPIETAPSDMLNSGAK